MAMSDAQANAFIDHFMRGVAVPTSTCWLVLFTGPVDPANPFATEATGYTRPAVTLAVPANGVAANTNTITVAVTVAQTITHVGFATAAALGAGTLILEGETSAQNALVVNEEIIFEPGDLDVRPG